MYTSGKNNTSNCHHVPEGVGQTAAQTGTPSLFVGWSLHPETCCSKYESSKRQQQWQVASPGHSPGLTSSGGCWLMAPLCHQRQEDWGPHAQGHQLHPRDHHPCKQQGKPFCLAAVGFVLAFSCLKPFESVSAANSMSNERNSAVRLYWDSDTSLTVQSGTQGNVPVMHLMQDGMLAYDRYIM